MITSPLSTNATAGATFSYQITASNSPTSFAASGVPSPLSFDTGTGVLSGNAPAIPGNYPINIFAINSAGTNSAILNLTVAPVVGAPVFSSATLSGTVGQAVTSLDLATLVSSNGPVAASSFGFQGTLPAGLSMTNRVVSGTPTSPGTNAYTFYGSNSAGFGTGTLTIAVQPALPFISATMPAGQVGSAVDFTFSASNSPTGYGALGLPYGLSISSNRITGTPTASGVYAVSLTATNANGSFTNTFNWTVASYSTNLPVGTSLISGWDFQTTNTGGNFVAASPNTPTLFNANFGAGTLYLNGTEGSSAWATNELDAATGTGSVNRGNGFSSGTPAGALQISRSSANGKYLTFKVNMASRSDLRISYAINGTSSGFTQQVWEASSNGSVWTKFAEVNPVPVPASSTTYSNQSLASVPGVDGQSNVWIRMQVAGASGTGNNKFDNIQFTAVGPAISLSTNTISGLSSILGNASAALSYTVSTANMGSPGVTASSLNSSVELSTNPAGPFGSSVNLSSSGGAVFVRLSAGAPAGAITGAVIRHTGDVATPVDLTVAGAVYTRGSSNTLVGWDAEDLTNATVPTVWSPTVANADITVVSGWSRETNGTVNFLSTAGWGGTSWSTDLTSTDAAASGRNALFVIQPKPFKKISLSSITKLDYRRSGAGPSNGLVRIQVGTNPWVEVATFSYTDSSTGGGSVSPIDLSTNPGLTNLTSVDPVKIQLVNFGATDTSGNWYLFDTANTPELDFELTGTVEDDSVLRLSSFSPGWGPIGTTVTISGANFTNGISVSFNGVAATNVAVTSPSTLTATVPAGATMGYLSVGDGAGAVTSSTAFVVGDFSFFIAAENFNFGLTTLGSFVEKPCYPQGGVLPGATLDILIDSPEFVVSGDFGATYGPSASIPVVDGSVDSNFWFVVAFAPAGGEGAKTGTATLSSGGVVIGRYSLTGTATGIPQPRLIYAYGQDGKAALAWTNFASLTNVVLLGREASLPGSPGAAEAFSGVTNSLPSAPIASNGASVLFGGESPSPNTNSLTVTGLTNLRFYYFSVYNREGTNVSSGSTRRVMPYADLSNRIAQWNFNSNNLIPNLGSGTATTVAVTNLGSGTGPVVGSVAADFVNGLSGSSDRFSSSRAASIKGSNNTFTGMQFAVSTAGKQGVKVYWDIGASGSASKYTQFQYTLDVTAASPKWDNYTPSTQDSPGVAPEGGLYAVDPYAVLQTSALLQRSADLSGVSGVENNPKFGFRVITANAPGTNVIARADGTSAAYSTAGTVKYDMVTVTGVDGNFGPVPGDGSSFAGWLAGNASSPESLQLYAFGAASPATTLNRSNLPASSVSNGSLVLTYFVRQEATNANLVTPQTTTNLVDTNSWGTGSITHATLETNTVDGVGVVKKTASVPIDTVQQKFLRLKISE